MVISNHPNYIYLVTDAGSPVAAFTTQHDMQTYLKRRHGTFNNPLVYTFADDQGHTPAIITLSRALAE